MDDQKMPLYISITDFTCKSEVEAMLEVMRSVSGDSPIRKLGVGVMMSRKTLNDLPSRYNNIFPAKETVADIFTSDPLVYNVLHYADYEGIFVLDNLLQAVKWSGPNLEGIQLDMIWPDPETLKIFREHHPHIQLILQINPSSLEQVNKDNNQLVERLKYYESYLEGVLLDMSMGRGVAMHWMDSLQYLGAISKGLPNIGLVVAGGLGPDSLGLVKPLVDLSRYAISIDAQGKLRPSGNMMYPIDWQMAQEYLIKAVSMFNKGDVF